MRGTKLFWAGLVTFVLASLCCFTPVLVVALSLLGLSAWVAWLDYVLLPLMGVGLAATVVGAWGLWRYRRRACPTGQTADSRAES